MRKSIVGHLFVATAIAVAPASGFAKTVTNETASASVNSNSSAETAASPGAKAEKKICKRLPSSHSRMNDRVCLTQRQWKQVEDQLD